MPAAAEVAAALCPIHVVLINLVACRWNFGNGYCGEMSVSGSAYAAAFLTSSLMKRTSLYPPPARLIQLGLCLCVHSAVHSVGSVGASQHQYPAAADLCALEPAPALPRVQMNIILQISLPNLCCCPQLQHIAMTRGIWISQQIARDLGVIKSNNVCQNGGFHDPTHLDLLFESRTATTNGKIAGELGWA
jgi:hypothetical protein